MFNPFHLSGLEAVLCTLIGCGCAVYIVRSCTVAAVNMTSMICDCVTKSIVAWTDVFTSKHDSRV